MNDVLEELFKVIDSFQTNIDDDPNMEDFVKEGHIEVLTHDNVLFELDVFKAMSSRLISFEDIVSLTFRFKLLTCPNAS